MNIIMLGAPGAGKGTYASRITSKYGLVQISTGDLFRNEVEKKTELGKKLKKYLDAGQLVPDEVTIEILKKKLAMIKGKGIIFDGFPRTVEQAKALDVILEEREIQIDYVLYINTPKELIIERISGRRVCKNCGAIYHTKNIPPKIMGVCDKCGKALYQREDDRPEVVSERFDKYEEVTRPLVNFYKKRKILHEIDGTKELDVVLKGIFSVLDEESSDVQA
jgi:adenylate kinase